MPTTNTAPAANDAPVAATLREQCDAAKAKLTTVQDAITAITVEIEKGTAKGAAKTKLTKGLAKLEAEAAELKPLAEMFDTRSGRKRPAQSIAPTEGEQTCTGACGEDKPLTSFPTISATKRGTECRACRDERLKAKKAADAAPAPKARKPRAKKADQAGAATAPEATPTPAEPATA